MSLRHMTVLVVEDEALVRMNMVMHLDDEGFQVVEAANAEEPFVCSKRTRRST